MYISKINIHSFIQVELGGKLLTKQNCFQADRLEINI